MIEATETTTNSTDSDATDDRLTISSPPPPDSPEIRRELQRRSPFYSLHFRNFRLFFIGQFISVIGTWMETVAQQWLVYSVTKSPEWLGIVSGASAIPYVIFAIWGGQVADRYPRRTTLIITQTIAMVIAFALAALSTNRFVRADGWHIALLAALMGVVNAFNMPAQQAFVVDIVEDREAIGNAIALNSLRFNLARFVGPVFAGWALVKAGPVACFTINGLSFIAVIASLILIRVDPRNVQQGKRDLQIAQGIQYILKARSVLRIILLLGIASLFTWSVSTVFPLIAEKYRSGAAGYSAMMAAQGAGAAIGGFSMAVFADRLPRRLAIYGGVVLQSAALVLYALAPYYFMALLFLAVSGFALIMFAIAANTKVQEDVPDSLRGRVMAVYSLVQGAMTPLGGLLIGFASGSAGVSMAVAIFSGVCLIGALGLWGWSRADKTTTVSTAPLPR